MRCVAVRCGVPSLFLSGAGGLCERARAGGPVRIDVCHVRFRWARGVVRSWGSDGRRELHDGWGCGMGLEKGG